MNPTTLLLHGDCLELLPCITDASVALVLTDPPYGTTACNEGETVLDFTMGSGTTGVACMNTGRNFIGIERDEKYFQIASERIEKAKSSTFPCSLQ